MKTYITILFLAIASMFTFTSCIDNTSDAEYEQYLKDLEEYNKKVIAQYKIDSLLITEYLAQKELPAVIDSMSGIFYNIVEPGNSSHPNLYSTITVLYKGSLLNGTIFDETKDSISAEFYLGTLISGWKIGLPKIGSQGKIILYLPSFYGYGSSASTKIPANSVTIFDVDLINFY